MRVKSVHRIKLQEPVPVYDLTVPVTENFMLAAGVFVHNTKDVADAVCGVAKLLFKRRIAWGTHTLQSVKADEKVIEAIESEKRVTSEEVNFEERRTIDRKEVLRKSIGRITVNRKNIARK